MPTEKSELFSTVADYAKSIPEVIGVGIRQARRGKRTVFFCIINSDIGEKLPKKIDGIPVYLYDKKGKLIKG